MYENTHLAPGWKSAHDSAPGDLGPGDKVYYTVVAVVGAINDWAAYYGYGSPDAVAAVGDKLDEATARGLFPAMEGKKYRR